MTARQNQGSLDWAPTNYGSLPLQQHGEGSAAHLVDSYSADSQKPVRFDIDFTYDENDSLVVRTPETDRAELTAFLGAAADKLAQSGLEGGEL